MIDHEYDNERVRPTCGLAGCEASVGWPIAGDTPPMRYCSDQHFVRGIQQRHQAARTSARMVAHGIDPTDVWRDEQRTAIVREAAAAASRVIANARPPFDGDAYIASLRARTAARTRPARRTTTIRRVEGGGVVYRAA
ncbi:hypothetical protein UG55_103524 [Frankia sp. EI5c]|uniref:hypothetical protein n=1 Tax=Frankia sp. EI5c TaxID=683316 RepID=UPI0007C3760D|nr:hypothetical protein [Frankia sp. EI5c]OAA23590.1 hypothetical protein UG55_103524 [Frankia sp. EI5c]